MNWLDKLMDLLNLDVLRLPELPTILKRKVREPEDVAPTETAEGEKPKEPIKPPLEGEAKEEPRKESPIEQIPKRTHELPDSSDLLSQGWDNPGSKPPKPTENRATSYVSPVISPAPSGARTVSGYSFPTGQTGSVGLPENAPPEVIEEAKRLNPGARITVDNKVVQEPAEIVEVRHPETGEVEEILVSMDEVRRHGGIYNTLEAMGYSREEADRLMEGGKVKVEAR